MFSYTCTQSCCNLPNNPHNGKTIQSNALLVISIFMMLNMEGKGSTLGKCQLCCCMIWSLQGRLTIALFIILAIFPMNIQGLKQKHFVASAQGQILCISVLRVLINDLENVMRNTFQLLYSYCTEFDTEIYRCWNKN